MTGKPPKLSVCIPTYNRQAYLVDALDRLLPQAEALGVDVFVSDNHSEDGTLEYLREQAQTFSCLRYHSNSSNIGLEKNMVAALQGGSGDYLLPIGDDEVLLPRSIEQILRALDEHDPDILILNGWHTVASLTPTREHLPDPLQGLTITQPEDAFYHFWDKTPPGSVIMKRDLLSDKNIEAFLGTSHAYSGAMWAGLSDRQRQMGLIKVRSMEEKTVLLRAGEKSWHTNSARIKLYEIPLWLSLLQNTHGYPVAASSALASYTQSNTRWRILIPQTLGGGLDKALYTELEIFYSDHQLSRIRRVLRTPAFILEPIHALLTGLSRIARSFRRSRRLEMRNN